MFTDLWSGVAQNILVSAVTGVALFVLTYLWRQYQNHRIQQKYPVGGRYLSYYEDRKDGQTYVAKAAIVLRQQGSKFRGNTENIERKREWALEGEVVGHGLLSGIYYPSSPHDPGRGMFFMEPNVEVADEYTGIWAGYDAVNRGVVCGNYRWRKLMDVTIKPIPEGRAADNALVLLRVGLGTGYIEEQEFRDYQAGKESGMALGAFAKDDLVGVLLARLLTREEAAAHEAMAKKAGVVVPLGFHHVGILKSIVVKDSARGHGIGTALCQEAVKRLKQAGATCVMAVSWESGAQDNSRGMLEGLGLQFATRVEGFWTEDSIKKGYSCPKCGNPCRCAALLYTKTV